NELLGGAVSGDLGRSWQVISALGCIVSPLYRLVRRVDPHGRTLECLHQLRAGRSADLARARAGLKKCSHRFPEIRDVLKKGLGVTISLVYQTLGIVAAEEPVVLQGPGVPGADRFHALGGETFEFLKLAMLLFRPAQDNGRNKLGRTPRYWTRHAR